MQTKTTSKTNNLKDYFLMASSQDYQTTGLHGVGWWNPGRSLFPPCSGPSSDFMWLDTSLNDMDEQADQMKQAAAAASNSRSDESPDDHHSSSADQHLHVMSSDYEQTFEHGHKPQVGDFSSSDWSVNNLLQDSSIFMPVANYQKNNNSHVFYNQGQFDTAAKQFQMELENIATYGYPATIQTLATGLDTDEMSCVFENSFAPNWPKLFMSSSQKEQLNFGTKHLNSNNSLPYWDSWMSNDVVDVLDSHQHVAPVSIENQKPCSIRSSTEGFNLISPNKVVSKDMIAQKLASDSTLLGTKRKNNDTSDETYTRPRFETPSSLPTFKVRKEKLGDRITALQQLVSPFGKTDTASVLHEAIEYIKFLHDQVLRTPYMQNETPTNQHQQMQGETKTTGSKFPKQDLKSRGLCLVPISSTFPVANETTADFWTPTFGGTMTFR